MNKIAYIAFLLQIVFLNAQTALNNSGNMQLHGATQIGIHTNWINDAVFKDADGLVGFYGNNPIQISGDFEPNLNDVEIFAPNNIFLRLPINIHNNINFIEGNILSALNNRFVYLNFEQESFFTGEGDMSKVTGFAAITDKSTFSFPVGDEEQLRPLLINSDTNNPLAVCAYLSEDPSNPSSIPETFDTEQKIRSIGEITSKEFWILQTDVPSTVTLNWNTTSDLTSIANTVEDIILVGWSIANNQWIAIGNSAVSGNLEQGFLVSEKFIPNEFAVITFGTIPLPTNTFAVNNPTLGNYFISPNGDGTNDALVFDSLENTGANFVYIYNKFGQRVYERANYQNEFRGFSNIDNFVLNREVGLPEGIYYYVIILSELELEYQGFFFLDR